VLSFPPFLPGAMTWLLRAIALLALLLTQGTLVHTGASATEIAKKFGLIGQVEQHAVVEQKTICADAKADHRSSGSVPHSDDFLPPSRDAAGQRQSVRRAYRAPPSYPPVQPGSQAPPVLI
jgi:hypothetical protein